MNDTKEQEVVVGIVAGVTVKKEGQWQAEINVEGAQYPKKPRTDDKGKADTLTAMLGQRVSLLCNISHWEYQGKPTKTLWVEQIGYDGPAPAAKPAEAVSAPQSAPPGVAAVVAVHGGDPRQMSIERQTAVKVAVEYMALLPEEHRSVEHMIAVAERVALFLSNGEGAEGVPF